MGIAVPLSRMLRAVVLLALAVSLATAALDAPLNSDDPAYIHRQYAWFLAQDPARQQQLRKLHADFQALEPDSQNRFERVLKNYNAWLARLPDADRQRVVAATTSAARLEIVRSLREREWVESLPKPYRDEYANLDSDARRIRVQDWRAEQAERDEEWAMALRHWEPFTPGKVPAMFSNENRALIDVYVGHLRENLSEGERRLLDDARDLADGFGNYFGYALAIFRLSELHRVLPGAVGPKDVASLPKPVFDYLVRNDKNFKKKAGGIVFGEDVRELRKAQGRWPDFASELTKYCRKHHPDLTLVLGDCRKEQMPPEVQTFLEKSLEPLLRRSDAGKAELDKLNRAQGQWPEYPQLIMDLAKKHKLAIPGWTLPGPPQMWERFRAERTKPRGQ